MRKREKEQKIPIVYILFQSGDNSYQTMEQVHKYCRFACNQGYLTIAPQLLFPQYSGSEYEKIAKRFMNKLLKLYTYEIWVFGAYETEYMQKEIHQGLQKQKKVLFFTEHMERA